MSGADCVSQRALAFALFWLCTSGSAVAVTLLIVDAENYYVGVTSSAIFWVLGLVASINMLSKTEKETFPSVLHG